MQLHDILAVDNTISILRVPGGWIYYSFNCRNGAMSESSTFVPYDNGFYNPESK